MSRAPVILLILGLWHLLLREEAALQSQIDTYGIECVEGATTFGKVHTSIGY